MPNNKARQLVFTPIFFNSVETDIIKLNMYLCILWCKMSREWPG